MGVLKFDELEPSVEQRRLIDSLIRTLRPGQALWLSGYFAGLDWDAGSTASQDQLSSAHASSLTDSSGDVVERSLTILFGSETGNSGRLARSLAEAARGRRLTPVLADMADYKPRKLKDEQDLLIVTSTHGEGDPPQSAIAFFEFLEARKAPQLPDVRYAVLALGDSTYEHYCKAGKRLDRRFAELGATRIASRVDCDVDYDEAAADWTTAVLAKLAYDLPAEVGATAGKGDRAPANAAEMHKPSFDKRRPFPAPVIDNFVLTGHGSSKETRHVEISLAGSGLTYEPGDALGVLPRNDPALVDAILDTLSMRHDASVAVKERTTTLGEALAEDFEISAATPRFIDHWAPISRATDLEALRGEGQAEARTNFLRHHHVIDILRRFPVDGVEPQTFLAGLRPLQPRLYSIASSQAFADDDVHLTVATVRYELHGEQRSGVASGFLADRTNPDTTLPIYIQANPHFRLPGDDVPILMIGAGTGVAPYRAFMQERESRGASGKSWLFFGERNFHSDFLYQIEWQSWLKDGILNRMSVAFSRDQSTKTYVQHRLLEQACDVYAWLEEGAHLYICGDATNLAPGVEAALNAIVQHEGGLQPAGAAEYLRALKSEHRYQMDVY